MYEPIFMRPYFRCDGETPWGGEMLRTLFDKDIPSDRTGESLEVSALPGRESVAVGGHYDGWKLVEGRSNRKYADETKVVDALKKEGFDEAMLYERKLLGITAMEKLVGKKKFSATLGDLIVKPAGKPVLVPESDKREAINTADSAKTDFDEDLPFC